MSAYGDFVQRVYGWREVNVLVGDTLSAIALRELGDAGLWVDIANLNGLREPYLVATAQERAAQPKTLAYGDKIRVPNTRRSSVAVGSTFAQYGSDIGLWGGGVRVDGGDLQVRSGLDNLSQAIIHRLGTDPGEILRHAYYGCHIRQVLGEKLNDVIRMLAQAFIVESLREEPRIANLVRADIENAGDQVWVSIAANPIDSEDHVEANLVFPRAQ